MLAGCLGYLQHQRLSFLQAAANHSSMTGGNISNYEEK